MGAQWNDGRRFEGRVAVVTGGGGTLGGAVARGFGSEGASVAIGYRSSRSQAAEVVAELEGRGGHAHSGHLDVTDQESVDAFVADVVERYGRLDVLVNAAGRLDEADTVRFSELDTAAASALLQVDVIGAMRMCHAVRPVMLEGGGGAIVNFSSTYGNGINPENAINFVPVTYSTAKGAIRGFTTTLARDLAPEIRVNALAPGPDLRRMGDRVGSLARAHRRGDRHEPAEAFRQAGGDRRDRPVLGVGRGRLHHRSGDPRGRRLGVGRLERACSPTLNKSPWQVHRVACAFAGTRRAVQARGWLVS